MPVLQGKNSRGKGIGLNVIAATLASTRGACVAIFKHDIDYSLYQLYVEKQDDVDHVEGVSVEGRSCSDEGVIDHISKDIHDDDNV